MCGLAALALVQRCLDLLRLIDMREGVPGLLWRAGSIRRRPLDCESMCSEVSTSDSTTTTTTTTTSVCQSVNLPTYLPVYQSVFRFVSFSIHPPPISPPIYMPVDLDTRKRTDRAESVEHVHLFLGHLLGEGDDHIAAENSSGQRKTYTCIPRGRLDEGVSLLHDVCLGRAVVFGHGVTLAHSVHQHALADAILYRSTSVKKFTLAKNLRFDTTIRGFLAHAVEANEGGVPDVVEDGVANFRLTLRDGESVVCVCVCVCVSALLRLELIFQKMSHGSIAVCRQFYSQ